MTTLEKLSNHIAQMAPHQKERDGGKILIEAKSEIERLIDALERIRRYPVHSEPVGGAMAMQDIAHDTLQKVKYSTK